METTLATIPDRAPADFEGTSWYNAFTLTERLCAPSGVSHSPNDLTQDTEQAEQASRRLLRWKQQSPFEVPSLFAQRLALDGMTEQELCSLLAEGPELLQARLSPDGTLPAWLAELRRAFASGADTHEAESRQEAQHPMPPLLPVLQPFRPLLKGSIDRLTIGINELSQRFADLPFDPHTVVDLLFARLSQQLEQQVTKTFVLELNVARLRGELHGETPAQRFQQFVQRLSTSEGMLPLLAEYCVLARHVVETIQRFEAVSLEFLGRLCADWQEICGLFTPEQHPGVLVRIQGGAGDTHRGGRSVMLLTFASGFQLVYKPRSLAIDLHFQELLTWLNEKGATPSLRTLRLLERGDYGWSELVSRADCTSQAQVERFYERQGSYLALLYALNAIDFHFENIIAVGEDPLLIDLEALFHPWLKTSDDPTPEPLATLALTHSVLRIGLLPQRSWSRDDTPGLDLSGLGGQAGQLSPFPTARWEAAETDQMHLIKQRVELTARENRPRLHGEEVCTLDYCDAVVSGFTRTYRLLMEHGEALCTQWLPRFAADEIRFVARATASYARLLSASFHPNLLRHALERDRLFDHLWKGVVGQPVLSQLIAAERADLLGGDIPLFTTRPESTDVFTSRGERIADVFAVSGLQQAQHRLRELDEADLARQYWLIRASFATLPLADEQRPKPALRFSPPSRRASPERLLAAADEVGRRVCQLAFQKGDGAVWFGLETTQAGEWHIRAATTSFYSGLPGIVLFLSYLGSLTGEAQYTELSRSALRTLRAEIHEQKKQPTLLGPGAFDGWGSLLSLFTHLAVLWNEPVLLQEAQEIVSFLPALIAQDDCFDLISGSAGCLACLLNLYAVVPQPSILATAIQCGDHLLAHAQPMAEGVGWTGRNQDRPLTGFAHGGAGIALCLLRLAEASGQARFRQTALSALAYERSLFSSQHQNWPDLRQASADPLAPSVSQERFKHAWCHGAAGIGLGRLAGLSFLDEKIVHAEIASALQSTIVHGFGHNHSLCHGDLGNLETLLVATRTAGYDQYREPFERLCAMALDSIERDGWVTGVPLGVETPGLMTGLAGIGYELLRLAFPERVPSVLLIEPPEVCTKMNYENRESTGEQPGKLQVR